MNGLEDYDDWPPASKQEELAVAGSLSKRVFTRVPNETIPVSCCASDLEICLLMPLLLLVLQSPPRPLPLPRHHQASVLGEAVQSPPYMHLARGMLQIHTASGCSYV